MTLTHYVRTSVSALSALAIASVLTSASAADLYGDLRVGSVRAVERSNYPLTVWAIPDRELVLRIGYDKRRFHQEWISQLLQDYQALLEQISEALWVKDLSPTKKHKIYKMNR